MAIDDNSGKVTIELLPSPVNLENVPVIAAIDALNVIKRAIARKKENVDKIKTFSGHLYTKFIAEIGGSVFESDDKDIVEELGPERAGKEYKMWVTETFSQVFNDYEKKKYHTEILQRRQTANMEAENNLIALGTFINFYAEEFTFMNTTFITPLSEDAPDFYDFELSGKTVYDNKYIYDINVTPKSDVFPGFVGQIKILEGDYNLIEVDLRPSDKTSIAFVDGLEFIQRFAEITDGIWYPEFLETKAKGRIDIIKGLITIEADFSITSIFNEIEINGPLPDSIYKEKNYNLSVNEKADSTEIEFWEDNALREITPREKEIYNEVDSLVAIKDSLKKEESTQNFGIAPYVDFNRVGSVMLGASPSFSIYKGQIDTDVFYSFGLQDILLSMEVESDLSELIGHRFDVSFSLFDDIEQMSFSRKYPRFINMLTSALFHDDYYNYYKNTGVRAGISTKLFGITLGGYAEYSEQSSLNKTTNNSIFSSRPWRANPSIDEGAFRTAAVEIGAENTITISSNAGTSYNYFLRGFYGDNLTSGASFRLLQGKIGMSLPTFSTGYSPMILDVSVEGGRANTDLPVQYQFVMQSGLGIFGGFGSFLSAGPSIYGGTEFYAVHAKYNLTDLWWRAIGLPLFPEGRGLELTIGGSAGRYFAPGDSPYMSTGNGFYSEVGFEFGKIPTFISNVIYLSFDAKWGIGAVASGNFGWAVSLSSPF